MILTDWFGGSARAKERPPLGSHLSDTRIRSTQGAKPERPPPGQHRHSSGLVRRVVREKRHSGAVAPLPDRDELLFGEETREVVNVVFLSGAFEAIP